MKKTSITIVSGISGAGKSSLLGILEDFNFLCLDNFPPPLIRDLIDLNVDRAQERHKGLALGIDIRWGSYLNEMKSVFSDLKKQGFQVTLIYLESSVSTLVKRFSETRRRHPFGKGDLLSHIEKEKTQLATIRELADLVIDTSSLSLKQLRQKVMKGIDLGEEKATLSVNLVSFGFKNGCPINADIVFDVRFLPNPYYLEDLKMLTGLDSKVQDYIFSYDEAHHFFEKFGELLTFLLPEFLKEGKSYLQVAIGCTGGKHRSVCMIEKLYQKFDKENKFIISRHHRDIHK